MNTSKKQVDFVRLQRLADQLKKDAETFHGLNTTGMLSVATIIEECIGAPVMMPTRQEGVAEADKCYRGSPSDRGAFNHGVKWTLEQMSGHETGTTTEER